MSTSSLPNTLPTVERLLQRISVADKSQQKEIRISIQEARDLTSELALLTSKLGSTVQEIHSLLSEIKRQNTEVDVKFDGGSF